MGGPVGLYNGMIITYHLLLGN